MTNLIRRKKKPYQIKLEISMYNIFIGFKKEMKINATHKIALCISYKKVYLLEHDKT